MANKLKDKNTYEWNEHNPCHKCDSLCCRDVSISLDTPKDKDDFDEIKWLIMHKQVSVYIDNESDWLVEFNTDCKNLDDDGLCKIHKDRPKTCYEHSHETCVFHNKETYYQVLFKTVQDVDDYIKKQNFDWA